jgi:DNA repair exonuclease SbcCD ATPase subunit
LQDKELSKQLKANETRASQLMKTYDNVREQLPPTKAKVEETQRVVQMLKRPQSNVEQILKEGAPPVQEYVTMWYRANPLANKIFLLASQRSTCRPYC